MKKIPSISFRPQHLDAREGFELLELEELLRQRTLPKDHSPFQPHRVTFFAILFIQTGIVSHQVDFRPLTVKAGECLLISKGQVQAFGNRSDYHGKLLVFTESFINKYIAPASIDQVHRLFNHFVGANHFSFSGVEESLDQIIQETKQGGEQAGIIGALLSILLLKLATRKNDPELEKSEPGAHQVFLQFRTLLEQHVKESRNATFYAQALGMSYKQLNRMCKMAVNQTAKAFIHHYVTLEASRQLVSTSHSIKEISYEMGFDEPTNFIKYFRRQTGHTPRQFRKKNT